jgi:hypothetical protein
MAETKKKKTTLAFDEDVYHLLRLTSVYLNRDMTDIIQESVVTWFVQNKEKLPSELKIKVNEIEKRFFRPQERDA